ncbi:hypothetical protein AGMMS49975_13560 [Clostridia bacterium]|nr:hypothetical protein AGMMS49975_13560 [Clostridia bacterium]
MGVNGALGFTYNNVHCSEFGIIARSVDLSVLPEVKNNTLDIPQRDGSYVFTGVSDRLYYKDAQIQILCQFQADNMQQLQEKVSRIGVWLSRPSELRIDSLPNVHWNARVFGGFHFAPILSGTAASITVTFEIPPFSLADEVSVITVESNSSVDSYNNGYLTPCIIAAENGSNLSANVAETSFAVSGSFQTLQINSDLFTVTKNGEKAIAIFSGKFPIIPTGNFTIQNNSDVPITVRFIKRFFYGEVM